jgi:hypothetical protein
VASRPSEGGRARYHYDWWQDAAGRVVLGKRKDGKYAATIGGIVWSIPRQVGKTFTIGSLLMVMCILFPGFKVIWTAHRTRTATSAFRSLQGLAKRKRIAPHIDHIRTANGEQEIGFRNGSVIMFGAREQGFGRGFDEVDAEVFDEAQILTEKALEDMVAATNQARHPHGALLFFLGTPPRPVDPGEEFTRRRQKAIEGKTSDMFYLEMGADPDADLDDRRQWAKANLSYPKHTPLESMLRLRENVGGDDSWRREGLGIWDTDSRSMVMPHWPLCASDEEPPAVSALAVAVDPDRVWISLGACSSGEVPHVGAVHRRRLDTGRDFIFAEAKRIQRETSCKVVIDRKGPAGSFEEDLTSAGVRVTAIGLDDYVTACAALSDAVDAKQITHGNYDELNAAVAAASKRRVGDRWAWARRNGDISMLEAVTLARFGASMNVASQSFAF